MTTPRGEGSIAVTLLGFALRDHDAAESGDGLHRRLSSLLFATAGFEARLNELYADHGDGRAEPVLERLARLLPRRERSRRRRRLLRDVFELRETVLRPPALRFVEQMGLEADALSGWDDGAGAVIVEGPPRRERYRPAELPANPLMLDARQLRTCLLVLLEHLVLLDRRHRPDSPLRVHRGDERVELADWFEEIRSSYDGPHAAYFRRIRTAPR